MQYVKNAQEKRYCKDSYGYPAYYVCQKMAKQNTENKKLLDENLKKCEGFIN